MIGGRRDRASKEQAGNNTIRETDASLQKIVEMGDDGIIVFDEDSRIGFANRMASDILGVPKEKIIGSEFYQLIGKSDQEFLADMVARESGLGQKFCTEMEIRTPGGSLVQAEVCIAPSKTDDGKSITYAYIRDITERKKSERERKESEEKYRNLFERVRHGIYISAKEGRFIDCNPTLLEMLGYENKEELPKIDIANDLYIHPQERLAFQRRIEKEGSSRTSRWSSRRKRGKDHRPSDSPRQQGRTGDDRRLRRDHHRYLGKKTDGKGAPGRRMNF